MVHPFTWLLVLKLIYDTTDHSHHLYERYELYYRKAFESVKCPDSLVMMANEIEYKRSFDLGCAPLNTYFFSDKHFTSGLVITIKQFKNWLDVLQSKDALFKRALVT